MQAVLVIIFGYILGSIPFGLVLTRLAGLGDIRKIGSGNIGATNVLRTGRKDLAILTILFDASKAGLAAAIASAMIKPEDMLIFGIFTNTSVVMGLVAGIAAIIGHNFPIFLGFKGGKGVASSFGFLLATQPMIALFAGLTWLAVAIATRYSSLSAITAAILVPFYTFFMCDPIYLVAYTIICVLLIFRHRGNIKRLINGQESKINLKKKSD